MKSLFPQRASYCDLVARWKFNDIEWSTRVWPTGNPFKVGQRLTVWMTEDPRRDDGRLPLASYVCTIGGSQGDCIFEKQERGESCAK